MRPNLFLPCAVLLVLGLSLAVTAGPLTPPTGAVMSTGRFGPAIDINTLAGDANSRHRITQPGSYYLSGNVTGASGLSGIEIGTSNVTIDLNGYSLVGVAGSLDGISVSAFADQVHIKNGIIRNWAGAGVFLNGGLGTVEDLTVQNNGAYGIRITSGVNRVQNCLVNQNGGGVPGTGGIRVDNDSVVEGCIAAGNTGIGVQTGFGCVVANNVIASNNVQGVSAGNEGCLVGNVVRNNAANTTANCTVVNNRGI